MSAPIRVFDPAAQAAPSVCSPSVDFNLARGESALTTRPVAMKYAVTADLQAGGRAAVKARSSAIAFDGSAQAGDILPGPADLLCAALAACILKNVERFSHILPFRYKSASIEVSAEREEPPPRIVRMHYRLRVVTDEPAARVELLHKNICKFGTITNTLSAACEVTGELAAVAPADKA